MVAQGEGQQASGSQLAERLREMQLVAELPSADHSINSPKRCEVLKQAAPNS
jgi:hypothetical protein